jgi:L-alanine-DL-glutamate epimerase-like enolase superfamily enzyme
MPRLTVRVERWPIAGRFAIARGSKTEAAVIVAEIAEGPLRGRGECVPYARYDESIEGVAALLSTFDTAIAGGLTRTALQEALPPGAARNALDCALVDFEAKASGRPAHEILGLPAPAPVHTAFTLSLDSADAMGRAAEAARAFTLLKVKLGPQGARERLEAVAAAAPNARIIVDANEAWTLESLAALMPALEASRVVLIEQPLAASADAALAGFTSPIPLCADESLHSRAELTAVAGRYQCVNIKLDKTGGLTEALALAKAARARGLGIMVGSMVATSLSMAPAMLLAQDADYVDLDGPLLLAKDREPGIVYQGSLMARPAAALWG